MIFALQWGKNSILLVGQKRIIFTPNGITWYLFTCLCYKRNYHATRLKVLLCFAVLMYHSDFRAFSPGSWSSTTHRATTSEATGPTTCPRHRWVPFQSRRCFSPPGKTRGGIFSQAGNKLGASSFPALNKLSMLFPYTSLLAGNEHVLKLTKNTASGRYFQILKPTWDQFYKQKPL